MFVWLKPLDSTNSITSPVRTRKRWPECLILSLTLSCLLLGCASGYRIVLNNGTIVTSPNKPKFDDDAHVWRFKDAQGKQHALPAFRVQEIHPL
jgi:hypothetical protein